MTICLPHVKNVTNFLIGGKMQYIKILAIAVVFFGFANVSSAQVTASHNVTIVVPTVNLISVSGDVTITVGAPAGAGSDFTDGTASGSYSVTTNESGQKITAQLSADYASGITLSASLSSIGGGTAAASTPLSTVAADLLTGMNAVSDTGTISYVASATAAAAANGAGETRAVTYTLTS